MCVWLCLSETWLITITVYMLCGIEFWSFNYTWLMFIRNLRSILLKLFKCCLQKIIYTDKSCKPRKWKQHLNNRILISKIDTKLTCFFVFSIVPPSQYHLLLTLASGLGSFGSVSPLWDEIWSSLSHPPFLHLSYFLLFFPFT